MMMQMMLQMILQMMVQMGEGVLRLTCSPTGAAGPSADQRSPLQAITVGRKARLASENATKALPRAVSRGESYLSYSRAWLYSKWQRHSFNSLNRQTDSPCRMRSAPARGSGL